MTEEQLKGERERGGDVPPERDIDLSEIMNFSPSIDLWGRAEGSAPDPERKILLRVNNKLLQTAILFVLMNTVREESHRAFPFP